MGGQEFLINHTKKEIVRIENDGHYDIANELRKVIKNHEWKLTDDVELVIYERCDKDRIAELILNQDYEPGEWEEWFVY
jgi:hypothetical protein